MKLGQSLSSLSGGEAQRLKLAYFLNKKIENTIMIFDEPTTGLHIHDIKKLLKSFNDILNRNNTIIIIEHNMEIIMNLCDPIIVMSYGSKLAEGNAKSIRNNKDVIDAYLGK